jgi:2-C-methyl-D-erythritol 2,4-cyclodiphosphate synthase
MPAIRRDPFALQLSLAPHNLSGFQLSDRAQSAPGDRNESLKGQVVADTGRVGIGYDIHRLVEGRRLVVGGIEIEYPKGLLGHSDADVVLHAVTDALLGAAGLPDLGDLFPDTDPKYKDADSRVLIKDAMERVRSRGFEPANVDLIVHAEKPKMTPFKRPIGESIADLVGLPSDCVSVKATTNEGLGPLGVSAAIACSAVVLLRSTT